MEKWVAARLGEGAWQDNSEWEDWWWHLFSVMAFDNMEQDRGTSFLLSSAEICACDEGHECEF